MALAGTAAMDWFEPVSTRRRRVVGDPHVPAPNHRYIIQF
jgi:hypothetical protein